MTVAARVFADFNDLLGLGDRVRLNTVGARADLERQGVSLQEGMVLEVYDHDLDDRGERDDLVALGTVQWDTGLEAWVAVIDRATLHNESERER